MSYIDTLLQKIVITDFKPFFASENTFYIIK